MMEYDDLINSGILELYAAGLADEHESLRVEQALAESDRVRQEYGEVCFALEQLARSQAIAPHATVKPALMAAIDYIERIQRGEEPGNPPMLHERSVVRDYQPWLERADMVLPEKGDDIYARIIGRSEVGTMAILWIRTEAPTEVHYHEHESFLIVEGTCDIYVGEKVFSLVPGDYMKIPLHIPHHVKVTSATPCKAILQRMAA